MSKYKYGQWKNNCTTQFLISWHQWTIFWSIYNKVEDITFSASAHPSRICWNTHKQFFMYIQDFTEIKIKNCNFWQPNLAELSLHPKAQIYISWTFQIFNVLNNFYYKIYRTIWWRKLATFLYTFLICEEFFNICW